VCHIRPTDRTPLSTVTGDLVGWGANVGRRTRRCPRGAGRPCCGINGHIDDTYLVKVGSTYHAFCKGTTTKATDFARASSLTGPYTFWKKGNWVS
jgi:hypothetical protein